MSINVSNHKLLMEPILRALWEIGYPAPKKEIYDKVIADNDIDEEFLKKIHTYTSGATVPEINYNIDWALTRLKKRFWRCHKCR